MDRADPQVTSAPLEAFRFAGSKPATLSQPDGNGRRKFSGVAYSGDMISEHWFWGNLVFDVSSTKAAASVPALVEHKSDRIAGSGQMTFGSDMRIEGLLSAKSPDAKFVADQADEQFPWQMSVFIEPGEIDQIKAGVKFSANGREFTGPATVFRNSMIREVSFTATGADPQTSAQVFTRNTSREGQHMDKPASTDQTVVDLQAQVTKLTADVTRITGERDAAREEGTKFRTDRLRALFTARGEDVSDEAKFAEKVKPFLAMSADAFNATMALMPTSNAQARDPNLFRMDGEGEQKPPVAPGKTGLVERTKAKFAAMKPAA